MIAQNIKLFLLAFLSIFGFGCERLSFDSVPIKNTFPSNFNCFPFYAYKNQKPEDAKGFRAFLFDEKGNWSEDRSFHEKPLKPFLEVGAQLFYPTNASTGMDLNESREIFSTDKQWAAKTYSIKTFADDLDNAYLVVRHLSDGNFKKMKVPAQSNGAMWPLFWHPQKPILYFMVTTGDTTGRSLELWECDVVRGVFQNVGNTNGDVYLSPDGRWILWETGPYLDSCHLKSPLHCVLLCAYDIEKKVNYRLTDRPSISLFQRWKN